MYIRRTKQMIAGRVGPGAGDCGDDSEISIVVGADLSSKGTFFRDLDAVWGFIEWLFG